MVEIVDLTLRVVIDSFETYTTNSWITKKISRLISLCPKLYLRWHNKKYGVDRG